MLVCQGASSSSQGAVPGDGGGSGAVSRNEEGVDNGITADMVSSNLASNLAPVLCASWSQEYP